MNRPSIAGLRSHLGRAALACAVAGIACMPAAHARTRDGTVVVPPSGLPEAARHAGESLLLVNSYDDRTLLYVEQDGGRTLTVLDVTDPGHVTVSSSLALEAPGPFEFVSLLGTRTALVRFRLQGDEAILDFTGNGAPQLKKLPGVRLQNDVRWLGKEGFIGRSGVAADAAPPRDYQVVETTGASQLGRVIEVHKVRTEVTNEDTGTIFLLAEDGLYLVRRPAAEPGTHPRVLERDTVG